MPICRPACSGPPALVSKFVDYDLPKLYSTWKPSNGPRGLVRALTPSERGAVQERISELAAGLAPYLAEEEDAVIGVLTRLLNGYRTLQRLGDQQAIIMVEGLRDLLSPYPFWAIDMACDKIRRGEAEIDGEKLSRKFAPHDTEICEVTKQCLQQYREVLDRSRALLAAPVEQQP